MIILPVKSNIGKSPLVWLINAGTRMIFGKNCTPFSLCYGLYNNTNILPGNPAGPAGPFSPGSPGCPGSPRSPGEPGRPRCPCDPWSPAEPMGPGGPAGPRWPGRPIWPGDPSEPGEPGSPWVPISPRAPGSPLFDKQKHWLIFDDLNIYKCYMHVYFWDIVFMHIVYQDWQL